MAWRWSSSRPACLSPHPHPHPPSSPQPRRPFFAFLHPLGWSKRQFAAARKLAASAFVPQASDAVMQTEARLLQRLNASQRVSRLRRCRSFAIVFLLVRGARSRPNLFPTAGILPHCQPQLPSLLRRFTPNIAPDAHPYSWLSPDTPPSTPHLDPAILLHPTRWAVALQLWWPTSGQGYRTNRAPHSGWVVARR